MKPLIEPVMVDRSCMLLVDLSNQCSRMELYLGRAASFNMEQCICEGSLQTSAIIERVLGAAYLASI